MEFIALNKAKLFSTLLGSVIFFAIGAGLFHFAETLTAMLGPQPLPISLRAAGLLGMGIFGLSGLLLIPKQLDARHGLVLDREGFLDNTNTVTAGRIRWEHVTAIREWSQGKTRVVVIMIDNPDTVIAEAGWYARLALRANLLLAGSPVAIAASALECSHEELVTKLNARWKAWREIPGRKAA
jgi:hypothetical protein